MAWLWWLTPHNVKNKGSCSWQCSWAQTQCSFAQTLGMESPFKLPSQCITWPAPFLKLAWSRWQSGQYSICIAAVRVLHVSLTSEIREKGGFPVWRVQLLWLQPSILKPFLLKIFQRHSLFIKPYCSSAPSGEYLRRGLKFFAVVLFGSFPTSPVSWNSDIG